MYHAININNNKRKQNHQPNDPFLSNTNTNPSKPNLTNHKNNKKNKIIYHGIQKKLFYCLLNIYVWYVIIKYHNIIHYDIIEKLDAPNTNNLLLLIISMLIIKKATNDPFNNNLIVFVFWLAWLCIKYGELCFNFDSTLFYSYIQTIDELQKQCNTDD